MERILTLDHRHHGKGTVLYSWHPSSQYLATVGTLTSLINGTITTAQPTPQSTSHQRCIWIWALNGAAAHHARMQTNPNATPSTAATPASSQPNTKSSSSAAPTAPTSASRGAEKLYQIFTPNPAPCIGLEWDSTGTTLAILQAAPAHEVLLWNFSTQEIEHVDLNIREPTFMRWSKTSNQLAIGTGRGELLLYDRTARTCWYANAKHKKRITCGDWNNENKFAFASDDRQITICSADGKTFGQVKVKSRPTNVKFGGNDVDRENIVSVSMDRKTILLYNLDDPENALELAFQARYGSIVSFKWFRDGYVMVGFSLGYLVVISTHLDEIGREQFCARFHKDSLRDIAYCSLKHKVATVGENCIKIIDMRDWRELASEEISSDYSSSSSSTSSSSSSKSHQHHAHANNVLDKLAWTQNGEYVSVSSRNGCLYVYAVDSKASSHETLRAAKQRELEESQALRNKIMHKPLNWTSMLGCASIITLTGIVSISNAVGLSLSEMWSLVTQSWSV